jgi:hypothetical protein
MSDVANLPFEQLRTEWLAHGLSTEPADFDAAERMIADLYSRVGLRRPSRFVRVASPPAGLRQLAEYEAEHGLPEPVFVPSTGWQQEYYETRGQTWIELYEKPWDTLLWAGWKLPEETREVLAVNLLRPLNERIEEGVCDPLWDQSAEDVSLTDEDTIHRWRGSCMWGQHYAPLFCYYSAMALIGVDISAGRPHMDIGTVCGWWWGLDDLVVMVDRPVEIGAAIGFRDDWAAILTQ